MFDFTLNTTNWIVSHGPNIIRTILVGLLSYWVYKLFLWRALKMFKKNREKKRDGDVLSQRVETLNAVLSKTAKLLILIIITATILGELGVNVAPMLAGFGVLGLAIGFGAQNLVKDIVNGAFILAEGQYSKGDIVEIADKKGKVEDINLRKTVLRDLDGTVHYIPNSLVGTASNKSQDWSSVNLDITVDSKENVDNIIKILNNVAANLYKDKNFSGFMLECPHVLGVSDFKDSKMSIKIIGKTKHLRKWDVTRELRKRIKEAFDKEKIKLA